MSGNQPQQQDEFEAALDGLLAAIKKSAVELTAQVHSVKAAYRASKLSKPAYTHTFKFNPPVERDSGPFRSMVSRLLDALREKKGMEYRIVEGKPGEVEALEFNAATEADRKAVENYGRWVQRTLEPPPTTQ